MTHPEDAQSPSPEAPSPEAPSPEALARRVAAQARAALESALGQSDPPHPALRLARRPEPSGGAAALRPFAATLACECLRLLADPDPPEGGAAGWRRAAEEAVRLALRADPSLLAPPGVEGPLLPGMGWRGGDPSALARVDGLVLTCAPFEGGAAARAAGVYLGWAPDEESARVLAEARAAEVLPERPARPALANPSG